MMHTDWISYLNTLELSPHTPADKQPVLAPLSHLAILQVSGQDAASFLQGQLSCDIKALPNSEARLGVYCNVKGRAISSFIIIQKKESFLLILTRDLLDTVSKKLQMYVLRSDVYLADLSDELCILGIANMAVMVAENLYQYPHLNNGFLFIGKAKEACLFCSQLIQQQAISLINANAWLGLDIQAGIPWLYAQTSEEFIPQMLNLDKLNALSFDKGCYIGQEIVARTHYLGKNKRTMYQAQCSVTADVAPGCWVINSQELKLGVVILVATNRATTQLLVVLKDQATETKNLQLNNQARNKIILHSSDHKAR